MSSLSTPCQLLSAVDSEDPGKRKYFSWGLPNVLLNSECICMHFSGERAIALARFPKGFLFQNELRIYPLIFPVGG